MNSLVHHIHHVSTWVQNQKSNYGLNLKTNEPHVSLLPEADFLMGLVTAVVADTLVTTTAVANTSTSVYVNQRELWQQRHGFSVFSQRGKWVHFDSQLPLTTEIAGVHRRLTGKSPVSRPDGLWTNGDRHTKGWSALLNVHNQGKEETWGREGRRERPEPYWLIEEVRHGSLTAWNC